MPNHRRTVLHYLRKAGGAIGLGVAAALLLTCLAAVASPDREMIYDLTYRVVEAIDNPAAEFQMRIDHVEIQGDQVFGDKFGGDYVAGDKISQS